MWASLPVENLLLVRVQLLAAIPICVGICLVRARGAAIGIQRVRALILLLRVLLVQATISFVGERRLTTRPWPRYVENGDVFFS